MPTSKAELLCAFIGKCLLIREVRAKLGVKVSLAITHQQGLMVAPSATGNPFDGHTLKAQLAQTNGLVAASGKLV